MKPRNKFDQRIVALHEKLKPITPAQQKWGIDNCLEKVALLTKKKASCLECGNIWEHQQTGTLIDVVLDITCPKCGCELKQVQTRDRIKDQIVYYAVVTTVEELQVIRTFYLKKYGRIGQKANLSILEVMQHWITPEGKVAMFTVPTQSMGWRYDAWCGVKLELRDEESHNNKLRTSLCPEKVYPKSKIIPKLLRNGFQGNYHDVSPAWMFIGLLQNPCIETLLKAKQFSMLRYVFYSTDLKNNLASREIWNSIKICMRNGYTIPDAGMWMDYVKLLKEFNKDLLKSHYVCPVDLKDSHDRLVRKKLESMERRRLEQKRRDARINQASYEKTKGKFFGLAFTSGALTVKVLESIEEFIAEGDQLKHCVFAAGYFKKAQSLILSARIDDTPIETIEISLDTLQIVQARGKFNKPSEHHDQVISLVSQNLPQIGRLLNQ